MLFTSLPIIFINLIFIGYEYIIIIQNLFFPKVSQKIVISFAFHLFKSFSKQNDNNTISIFFNFKFYTYDTF